MSSYRRTVNGLYTGKDTGRNDNTVAIVHVLEEENAEVEIIQERRT